LNALEGGLTALTPFLGPSIEPVPSSTSFTMGPIFVTAQAMSMTLRVTPSAKVMPSMPSWFPEFPPNGRGSGAVDRPLMVRGVLSLTPFLYYSSTSHGLLSDLCKRVFDGTGLRI
jgi:hypothetical protein